MSGTKYVSVLRTWIVIQSLVAFGNTVQCFTDFKYMASRLYTNTPGDVNPLVGRIYGLWSLLCTITRLFCAVDIHNKTVYLLGICSFLLAVAHFTSELLLFKTAAISIGILVQITLSGLSILFMLIGYRYLGSKNDTVEEHMDFRKMKVKTMKTQ